MVEERRIHCAKRTGHGSQNFVEGAQNSCNPVFIEVGLRLGVERYYKYFRQFGLHTLWDESLYSYGLDQHNFTLAMLLVALVWGVSMLQEKFNKDGMTIRDVIAKQNILFRWLLYLGLIAGILVFGMYGSGYNAGAFFYGKF